jgi:hypothetical protein
MTEVRYALSTQRQKFVVNSHPFPTLLWLLLLVVAAPVITSSFVQAVYSEAVNKTIYY